MSRIGKQPVAIPAGVKVNLSAGKIRVEGEDAEAVLQRVCANDVAVAPGRIVYTQWLNDRGGIEADVTVTRLSETAFLIVTGAATLRRDIAWLKRHIPDEAQCAAVDVTSSSRNAAIIVSSPFRGWSAADRA